MKLHDRRVGDWVEIRSKQEILSTLDSNGCLEGMPFMPEMTRYCGQRFRVYKSAHKTCDTVNNTGGRSLARTVHLEHLRCDGSSHGGCEAGCLLFWNEAWIKPADPEQPLRSVGTIHGSPCTETTLTGATSYPQSSSSSSRRWRCQATELPRASAPLQWWHIHQYCSDVTSGNHSLTHMVRIISFALIRNLIRLGVGYRFLVGSYNFVQRLRRQPAYPDLAGLLPEKSPTPTGILDLQPGELVRVKSHDEIRLTISANGMNRGMRFDTEMVKYCGRTFRVQSRISRILNEKTGEMMTMKSPCIVLQDVFCRAECTPMRLGCPREVNTYWREIWLRRVRPDGITAPD